MQDSLAFEAFDLKQVHEAIMIFYEIADKLRDVSEPLYFQVVLAEIPENVRSHHGSLLNGTRPAIHHR